MAGREVVWRDWERSVVGQQWEAWRASLAEHYGPEAAGVLFDEWHRRVDGALRKSYGRRVKDERRRAIFGY